MNPERESGYRSGWNHCADNLERAIKEFEQRERMTRTLAELRDAPAMDLRVRHALIAMDVNPLPLERTPTLAVGAKPTAREVVGDFGGGV